MMKLFSKRVLIIGLLGIMVGALVLTLYAVAITQNDDAGNSDTLSPYSYTVEKGPAESVFARSNTVAVSSRSGTVSNKPKN